MKPIIPFAAVTAVTLAFAAPQAGAVADGNASCIAQHNIAEATESPGALAAEFTQFAGPGFGGAIAEVAQAPRGDCPPE